MEKLKPQDHHVDLKKIFIKKPKAQGHHVKFPNNLI